MDILVIGVQGGYSGELGINLGSPMSSFSESLACGIIVRMYLKRNFRLWRATRREPSTRIIYCSSWHTSITTPVFFQFPGVVANLVL